MVLGKWVGAKKVKICEWNHNGGFGKASRVLRLLREKNIEYQKQYFEKCFLSNWVKKLMSWEDRAWHATVHGVARARHDSVTEQQQQTRYRRMVSKLRIHHRKSLTDFYITGGSTKKSLELSVVWETFDLSLQWIKYSNQEKVFKNFSKFTVAKYQFNSSLNREWITSNAGKTCGRFLI